MSDQLQSMNESFEKGMYFVAVKLLLREGDSLLITHDVFGDWDLPGGRIKINEFGSNLSSVVSRKMKEELGELVQFKVGDPKVFFQVERIEANTGSKVRIFAIGFEAEYLSGEIILGDHHDKYEWVNVHEFDPEKKFTGGWLKGVQEYLGLLNAE